ncbi:hypothetical protein Cantr_06863 [Candida viswanathii]|uniref:F-box domain-containing protein n=1 Tax=Candida viswanathii TaxID=5486 RepID=A0A367XW07_9ASCO|nr:hypothetical protein Cantr_06863 [Candida viswanathii]
MPGVLLTTIVGFLVALAGTLASAFSLVLFLVVSLIVVFVGAFKALEIDFIMLIILIIYVIVRGGEEAAVHRALHMANDSLLSLPEELIEEVIDYLNQTDRLKLLLMNRRLHHQVKRRLLTSVYVNNGVPSAFYRRHTIVSENQFEKVVQSDDFRYVKKAVFYSDAIPDHILQAVLRKDINLSFEHVVENKLKYLTILQRKRNPLWVTPDFPVENTITQLTVNYNGETISRAALSKLKLNSLKALNITSDAFERRGPSDFEPIEIKKLSFEFVDKQPSLAFISNTFQVDKVESLELRFKTRPLEYEIIQLMSKLISLKHFAIMSQNIRFDRVVEPLARDTLETLYVNVMGRYDSFLATILLEILKNQSGSIQKLSWSNKRLNVRLKTYGLDDFERVYDVDATAKDLDVAEIKMLVGNGFASLTDVILNEAYYKVSREESIVVVKLIN